MAALGDLNAKRIAVPKFDPALLARGHAVHFRCAAPGVEDNTSQELANWLLTFRLSSDNVAACYLRAFLQPGRQIGHGV